MNTLSTMDGIELTCNGLVFLRGIASILVRLAHLPGRSSIMGFIIVTCTTT